MGNDDGDLCGLEPGILTKIAQKYTVKILTRSREGSVQSEIEVPSFQVKKMLKRDFPGIV